MKRTTYCMLLLVTILATVTTDKLLGQALPELGSNVYQPQLLASDDGDLLLVWKQREGRRSSDLLVSRWHGDSFTEPVRANDIPGSVNSSPIDEMRAALAGGPGKLVALAWTDGQFNIRVAVSKDGGTVFGPSLQLNQDTGRVLQEFPAIAFDSEGGLHAVWLDPRRAEEGAEEPADLYHARVRDGEATEQNLTEKQQGSVCGCCLPAVGVGSDGKLRVAFRNTTPDGYRDIFRLEGTPDGHFGPPEPVSPPIWRINACPVAGPLSVGEKVLWIDGSTGRRRLLSSRGPDEMPDAVLEDSDVWSIRYPPRFVSPRADFEPLVLIPGRPVSYLLRLEGDSWRVLIDDLPGWATSAALVDGKLLLVGSVEGALNSETREFNTN